VAGQRRLTISRLRVPNLDGAVMAAARNLLSIGAPRHWTDPEIVRSQDTNQQKQRGKTWKNLPTRVPSQRRLAISRSRVPNLDGFVPTATGDLLSIGAPRHWCDPEIKWSQQTNQKKQRGKNLKKNLKIRVPGQRRLAISRLRVPNLDGFVTITAGNLLSIGTPRHRPDPEITRSQHTNQQKQKGKNLKKNLRARVPGQRRLAISRSRVPNLDGCVIAAAGNLFSIGTPRHWFDTEIARS